MIRRRVGFLVGCAAAVCVGVRGSYAAPPGARIAASFPTPGEVREADRTLAKTARDATDLIAYSPDGRLLASAGVDKAVRIWDAQTGEHGPGQLLQTLPVNSDNIVALAFAANGSSLLALGADQSISAWDPSSGKMLKGATTEASTRHAIFCPGNAPLLGECTAEGARLWNYQTGKVVQSFSNQGQKIRLIAFTPDGRTLAGVTRTGGIRLWDVTTGQLIRSFETRTLIVAIAANGTYLVVGAANGGIELWPIAGGGAKPFAGDFPVAFNPAGDQLAATVDNSIGVWNIASGALLCVLQGPAQTSEFEALAFSGDGGKIASADIDGTIKYWTAPLPPLPPADLDKISAALPEKAAAAPQKPRRLLVFWRSEATSTEMGVPAGNRALEQMGGKTGAFHADFSRDYAALDPKVLVNYDALVLNGSAHLILTAAAKKALLGYVNNGGGVIGIGAAIDNFKDWPEGAAILGATSAGHPWGPAGTWAIKVEEPGHPLSRAWAERTFKIHDEFYEMAEPFTRNDRRVLLSLDVSDAATAHPGPGPLHRPDRDFAVAWIRRFGLTGGRIFYAGFGQDAGSFENPAVLQFYLDGIQYVLGDLALPSLDELPRG